MTAHSCEVPVPAAQSNMTSGSKMTTTPAAGNLTNKTGFLTYANSTYGIRMLYPSVWTANRTTVPSGAGGIQVASFYPSNQRVFTYPSPSFSIGIDNLSDRTVSLDNYFKSTLKDTNSTGFPGLKSIETTTNNVTLAGHPAYRMVWTFMDTHRMVQTIAIESGTVIGDKGYFVAFYSDASKYYSTYLPTVKRAASNGVQRQTI
jgi:hypothetical protein